MAANPTTKVLAMYLVLLICVPIIMLTYVMVLNAMTELSEDIFTAIELCQHIMGPSAMNSHAIVVKPLPLHYCIMRSITVVVSVVRENCLQWGNYLLCSSVVNNPPSHRHYCKLSYLWVCRGEIMHSPQHFYIIYVVVSDIHLDLHYSTHINVSCINQF
jgi:hypothetical protein